MPKNNTGKQVNIMNVNDELYLEFKAMVKAAGFNLEDFNTMMYEKGMRAEIAASKKAGIKPGAKLFTDIAQGRG